MYVPDIDLTVAQFGGTLVDALCIKHWHNRSYYNYDDIQAHMHVLVHGCRHISTYIVIYIGIYLTQ